MIAKDDNSAPALSTRDIAILGMGRMGKALRGALLPHCRSITDWNRQDKAQAYTLPSSIGKAHVVILAVADGAIASLASAMANQGIGHKGQIILHCAGRVDASILAPLRARGCDTGSMHPFQPIAANANAETLFNGAYVGTEGTPSANATAAQIASTLGGNVFSLQGVDRIRYHAAAVVAANFSVTLAHIGHQLLLQAGLDPDLAPLELLLPLMQINLDNLAQRGLPEALTGPVSRAELGTMQAHHDAMATPDQSLYLALCQATLPIAKAQQHNHATEWSDIEGWLRTTDK